MPSAEQKQSGRRHSARSHTYRWRRIQLKSFYLDKDRSLTSARLGSSVTEQAFSSLQAKIVSIKFVIKKCLFKIRKLDEPAISTVRLLVAEELEANALPVAALQLPVRAHLAHCCDIFICHIYLGCQII